MAHVMVYLDEETEQVMHKAAERAGLPCSRWVAGLIRAAAGQVWPKDFFELSGAFPDAPLAEDIRAADAADLPRISW